MKHHEARGRARTADRGPPAAPGHAARIHATTQIGPKRRKLPNGSLLCEDVPLARTGWLIYGPGETPIRVGSTHDAAPLAYVYRSEEDLFSPETMGSFIGAAVVDEHPATDVTPKNWKSIARGTVVTVRRGVGDSADVLLGDILVTDQGLIDQIDSGKREVSAGYEADYAQTGDGEGRQFNIIANHVALVRKGRCGPRCSIGDRAHETTERTDMPAGNKTGRAPRARARLEELGATIAAELEQMGDEDEDEGNHVHVHVGATTHDGARTLDAAAEERMSGLESGMLAMSGTMTTMAETLAAIQASLAAGTTARTTDAATAEGDSKALERSFQEMVAHAEVLVPGFRVPTFDSAATRKATVDSMCGTRRSVLGMAYGTAAGKALVDNITGMDVLEADKMDCAMVATVFRSAALMKGAGNNRSATADSARVPANQQQQAGPKRTTAADINAANSKYWAERGGMPSAA